MNKRIRLAGLLIMVALCSLFAGCAPLQEKIDQYSSSKELCSLNQEHAAEFFYQSKGYTILEDQVSNGELGEWVGYIRQFVVVDAKGSVVAQADMKTDDVQTLADLAEAAPDGAYLIPFLNVYAAPNEDTCFIVDVNGGYHKAIPSDTVVEGTSVIDFTAQRPMTDGRFEINPDNATQLLCNGRVYQVTSQVIDGHNLEQYLDLLAVNMIFDADSKKPLSKEALYQVDWSGSETARRETWFYTDVYSISGTDPAEAVAVMVNNQYYMAGVQ